MTCHRRRGSANDFAEEGIFPKQLDKSQQIMGAADLTVRVESVGIVEQRAVHAQVAGSQIHVGDE